MAATGLRNRFIRLGRAGGVALRLQRRGATAPCYTVFGITDVRQSTLDSVSLEPSRTDGVGEWRLYIYKLRSIRSIAVLSRTLAYLWVEILAPHVAEHHFTCAVPIAQCSPAELTCVGSSGGGGGDACVPLDGCLA